MKTIYFYFIKVFKDDKLLTNGCEELKKHLIDIIEINANQQNEYKTLQLPKKNGMHVIADVFEYLEDKLFIRLSKQRPAGDYLFREYSTHTAKEVLADKDEQNEGIEKYTYLMLDYRSGVMDIINQQGAPTKKDFLNILAEYKEGYWMKAYPIPNGDAIDVLYGSKNPRVSKIELELPAPNLAYLSEIMQWNDNEILAIANDEDYKVRISISPKIRNNYIAEADGVKRLIQGVKNHLPSYNKANVRAKTDEDNTKDYNFYEENFKYLVKIKTSEKDSQGIRHYFNPSKLLIIYKSALEEAFNKNKEFLYIMTQKKVINDEDK